MPEQGELAALKHCLGGLSSTSVELNAYWSAFATKLAASGVVPAYGLVGDGVTDDTTALQAVITAAAGRPILLPAGTFVITAQLTDAPGTAARNRGTILIGQGPQKTIFDNRVANNAMIKLDTGTNNAFQVGSVLAGFQIMTTTSPAASDGIYLRRQQNLLLQDLYITNLSGDGIEIEVATGDPDASYHLEFRNLWVELCDGWGINCNLASGRNELSYLFLNNCVLSTNGTTSGAAPPPSGGMQWKGQVAVFQDTAFVTNENVGLYVPGGSGASNTLTGMGLTFENNKSRALLIQTLSNGCFIGTQFFQNNTFTATVGADLTTATGSNAKIRFLNSIVKVTSGNNPHTQWTISGDCSDCVIEDTVWHTYDGAGQTRFSAASFALGTRVIDDGVYCWGHASTTGAARGDIITNNAKGIRGLVSGGNNSALICRLNASDQVEVGSASTGTLVYGAEISDPAAPSANTGVLYFKDNGAGKTQLVARFPTGAVQVIATEP